MEAFMMAKRRILESNTCVFDYRVSIILGW